MIILLVFVGLAFFVICFAPIGVRPKWDYVEMIVIFTTLGVVIGFMLLALLSWWRDAAKRLAPEPPPPPRLEITAHALLPDPSPPPLGDLDSPGDYASHHPPTSTASNP